MKTKYICLCLVGSITQTYLAVKYTKKQNLGQMYGKRPKYKSKNNDGYDTGIGYAFEDLTYTRLKRQGKTVKRHPEYKNGADLTVDDIDCQLKCGTSGIKSATRCYEPGIDTLYKYDKQDVMVPKGQGEQAQKVFRNRKNNGRGGPMNVVESPVTREEARRYSKRGLDSLIMDLRNPEFIKHAVFVAGLITVFGTIIELINNKEKNHNFADIAKTTSKWVGIGLLTGTTTLFSICMWRQFLRPR